MSDLEVKVDAMMEMLAYLVEKEEERERELSLQAEIRKAEAKFTLDNLQRQMREQGNLKPGQYIWPRFNGD